jgi:hypothetical protein
MENINNKPKGMNAFGRQLGRGPTGKQ